MACRISFLSTSVTRFRTPSRGFTLPDRDPTETAVRCSTLGLPAVLAMHAEVDRKRELEEKLRAVAPDPNGAVQKKKRRDHSRALKDAYDATDSVVARLRASMLDKIAETDNDLAEIARIHAGAGHAEPQRSPSI